MSKSRIGNSIKNMSTGVLTYLAVIVLQFVNRIFFLKYLSVNYLGINGLFTNMLSMLNIAELGIAGAMVYALYKPLSVNDIEAIKAIMLLYKKLYRMVGITILTLGVVLIPFLNLFINVDDIGQIQDLRVYFLLYVVDAGISYFLSYKRNIIICNQEYYIINGTNFLKVLLTNVFQVIILIFTQNYFVYLLIKLVFTFGENVLISVIADRKYPYLKEDAQLPNRDFTNNIKKNIMAMSMHKVGTIIVFGTDNIIISKLVSLAATGVYSNYTMIINAASSILSQFFTAITASVGNLIAEKKNEKSDYVYMMFKNIYFINFCLYYLTSIGLFICLDNFITIWIGQEYLLDIDVVFCVVLSFFSLGMRKTVLVFKDADGLFWKDRYKPIAEAVCNILFSIPLTMIWGISGTLLGTIVTNIFIAGTIEAIITYKYLFRKSVIKYFCLQVKYYLLLFVSLFIVYWMCRNISADTIGSFILRGSVGVFISILVILFFCRANEEFKYAQNIVYSVIFKKRKVE